MSGKSKKDGYLSVSERIKLAKLYRRGEAAFGSIQNLKEQSGFTKKQVKNFLQSKQSYTKHKQAIRKHPRLPLNVRFVNEIWCMDLAQVDKLAHANSGTKYLMIVVDVFSRFVRVGAMRNKNAESNKACFIKLCSIGDQLTFPKKLWIDSGKEFLADFRNFCEDADIVVYSIHTEMKALLAERYIRTLKKIIYRYLEEYETEKYLPALQDFVSTMNSRVNRSIGMKPKDVKNEHYLQVLYTSMKDQKTQKPKLKSGVKVRLALEDYNFRKGYKPQFTHEIYQVEKVSTEKPVVTYIIKNSTNGVLKGR